MWSNMWTRLWLIATYAAVILGDTTPSVLTLSIGDELPTTIQTIQYDSYTCNLETPANKIIQFRPQNEGDPDKYELRPSNPLSDCSVTIKITGAEDVGTWRLFIELKDGTTVSQLNNVEVEGLPEIGKTTASVDAEASPELEQRESQFFNTHFGAVHEVTIGKRDFVNVESCHLAFSDSTVYNKEDEIAGISWINDENVACGVKINVTGDHLIGDWILYLRASRFSIDIETRQPFTIYIEEFIRAAPESVEVASGNNILIRLAEPAPDGLQDTCKLVHENKDIELPYVKDENNIETCGFLVRNVRFEHKGVWYIVLGKTIIYKASIEVNVHVPYEPSDSYVTWEMNSRVDTLVGPENAVYCSVLDPAGRTVFQDFSRCRITIERVTQNHKGNWILIVGTPGRITTDEYRIYVMIENSREVAMPNVITHVDQQLPDLLLSCSLPNDYQVQTCKFRNPQGRVLLAATGVSEDHNSLSGDNVILSTNVSSTGCGLRITNPTIGAVGFWRCAVETTENLTFYGFLEVQKVPGFVPDTSGPTIVNQVPTLKPKMEYMWVDEGDAVSLSCSIHTAIEYCYFSSSNGTLFNVHPGLRTDSIEYVGAGFQAGECGIRMTLFTTDSGLWSCNVGYLEAGSKKFAPEQRAHFSISVEPIFKVIQSDRYSNGLLLQGQLNYERAVDYCRYIRSDGMGFNEQNLPPNYNNWGYLTRGQCQLFIEDPSMLDRQPWTIITRLRGHREEISRTTNPFVPPPPSPPPPPPPSRRRMSYFWFFIVLMSITLAFIGLMASTEKNRRWTSQKAVAFRNSLRFKKKLAANTENVPVVNTGNTPTQPV